MPNTTTLQPAAFLDRDGTLIADVDYLRSVNEIRVLPGAAEAVRLLNEAGVSVVVVTNQAGIARGFLDEAGLLEIHLAMLSVFDACGARIQAVYYCPHHPTEGPERYRRACSCRKPKPGMILRASRELGLEPARSVLVGDSLTDAGAGLSAGCGAVYYVGNPAQKPGGVEPVLASDLARARRAKNLLEAVQDWLAHA